MAVFMTGDKHGNFTDLINFINKMNLTENDSIIVLGDMGLYWQYDMKDTDAFIKWYESNYKVNIYFIDGNHENFNLLGKQPIIINKKGEMMRKCSDHIFHLMRGHTYEFAGKKCLALGGADSVDKHLRTLNLSWWAQEQIVQSEIDAVAADHYDYVFTHCCPTSIFMDNQVYLCTLGKVVDDPSIHISEARLEELKNKITFDHWCFRSLPYRPSLR